MGIFRKYRKQLMKHVNINSIVLSMYASTTDKISYDLDNISYNIIGIKIIRMLTKSFNFVAFNVIKSNKT